MLLAQISELDPMNAFFHAYAVALYAPFSGTDLTGEQFLVFLPFWVATIIAGIYAFHIAMHLIGVAHERVCAALDRFLTRRGY